MAANPDPVHITDAEWRFWEEFKKREPTARLGGIYARKTGYHDTREQNPPSNYSVAHVVFDRQGPDNKAAGVDLTLPDAKMRLYTSRLDAAARRRDPRLYIDGHPVLREFIGTKNSSTVYCWVFIAGKPLGVGADAGPDPGRDDTHLWHIHLSGIRKFANVWRAWAGVLAVLFDVPLSEFIEGEDDMAWDELLTNRVWPNEEEASGHRMTAEDRLVSAQGAAGEAVKLTRRLATELAAVRGELAGLTTLVQQLATADPVPLDEQQLRQLTDAVVAAAAGAAEQALERTSLVVRDDG